MKKHVRTQGRLMRSKRLINSRPARWRCRCAEPSFHSTPPDDADPSCSSHATLHDYLNEYLDDVFESVARID